MTDIQAAILGFVQGATEFLPVSSTAHIYLADKLMFDKDSGAAFTAIIQWGTLLASLIYFRKDIVNILFRRGAPEDKTDTDQHLLVPIIVGTIPVVITGLLLKHKIEHEFRSIYIVAGSMIGFAILLAIAEKTYKARKQMGDLTLKDGLIVGIAQMFALVPGASRSGTTITGALFAGIERSTAARFSFLLSLPAVFGAGAKELYDALKHRAADAPPIEARPIIIATVIAFIVGYVSIDWLLKFLRRSPTYVFVVYRIVVGLTILGMAMSGKIQ